MKVTRIIFFISTLMFFATCEEDERNVYSNEDGRWVAFNVWADSNGELVDPSIPNDPGKQVDSLDYARRATLKIPVSITSEPFAEAVTVGFSSKISDNLKNVDISPANELVFSPGQLNDTIYINFGERWDAEVENSIYLKLESVSDPNIQIGAISDYDKFDELQINLQELELTCYFVDNRTEVNGTVGETVVVDVWFPNGFFISEIDTVDLLSVEADFGYELKQLPLDAYADRVSYTFTVTQDIGKDSSEYYQAQIYLNSPKNYVVPGNDKFTVVKPVIVPRDNSLNIASYFYDIPTDEFNRVYGETWMDFNVDGVCDWQSFSTFTVPVVVGANHPSAVLFSGDDTPETSDDVYHHAFRIGFNTRTEGRTVNSLNLKRWFNNEYTDADLSPGFNILEALEFFPGDEGTSATEGIVKVVEQELLISSRGDVNRQYVFNLSGEGTYKLIDSDNKIFELILEVSLDNEDLFGGTRTAYYHMYNTDEYEEPEQRTDGCFQPIDL